VALLPPLVALALLAGRFHDARLHAEHAQAAQVASGPLPRRFWIYWAVLAAGTGIEWCVAYWGADFLDHAAGLSRAGAATALSAFFAAMLAGRVAGSRLARRIGAAQLLPLALGLALLGFPLLWLARAPQLALLGLLVVGLGVANVYPLTVAVAVEAAGQRRDQATARLLLAGGGSVLLAPLALGALADQAGITRAFGVVAPLLCGAVALAWLARRDASPAD
jgi:fucose permease